MSNESVTDSRNQQFIPALIPQSTIPACQASARMRSSACVRHTAMRFAVLPPPT